MMRRLHERDADVAAMHIRICIKLRGATKEIFTAMHEILELSRPALKGINLSSHFQAGMTHGDFAYYVAYAAARMTDL
jgi:hypothetical protein